MITASGPAALLTGPTLPAKVIPAELVPAKVIPASSTSVPAAASAASTFAAVSISTPRTRIGATAAAMLAVPTGVALTRGFFAPIVAPALLTPIIAPRLSPTAVVSVA